MKMDKHCCTDERNAQIVIALLKAHGIRKVIANPGTTNIPFVGSIQSDSWFQVYSGIDERHSAYMAVGMAHESGEPVVLSCTGATASRNYLPALTEAYYRKLPVLAITSIRHFGGIGNLLPQMIDRSVHPRDVVRQSVQIPIPQSTLDEKDCELKINRALLELSRDGGGPVHINLETTDMPTFNTVSLPPVRIIKRVSFFDDSWPTLDARKKIVICVGSHKKFSQAEVSAIEKFVERHNAMVCVDATSSYYGKYAAHIQLISVQNGWPENPRFFNLMPEVLIQIGEISGDYPAMGFYDTASAVWRVNPDGEVRDLQHKLAYVFDMPETAFFNHYSGSSDLSMPSSSLYSEWLKADAELRRRIPDLPFSNLWMASKLHDRIPKGSVVHLGILNSLRCWNFFPFPEGIESSSNVGGFGIDGNLSTLIGASLVNPDKLHYLVLGDLAFFYDLNALGNRHVGRNVRILLINNGCGAEFKLSTHYGSQFGDQTDDYIAAGRHFGNKSRDLVRHYATDLGFQYLTASSKDEFLACAESFVSRDGDKPILFECFTTPNDESDALRMLSEMDPYVSVKTAVKSAIKSVLPDSAVEMIRGMLH